MTPCRPAALPPATHLAIASAWPRGVRTPHDTLYSNMLRCIMGRRCEPVLDGLQSHPRAHAEVIPWWCSRDDALRSLQAGLKVLLGRRVSHDSRQLALGWRSVVSLWPIPQRPNSRKISRADRLKGV